MGGTEQGNGQAEPGGLLEAHGGNRGPQAGLPGVFTATVPLVPYIGLGAAGAPDLRVSQIGVVGGGDEVVGKGLVHVLEHTRVGRVQGSPIGRQQVHHEAIQCHQLMLLGYRDGQERTSGHMGDPHVWPQMPPKLHLVIMSTCLLTELYKVMPFNLRPNSVTKVHYYGILQMWLEAR